MPYLIVVALLIGGGWFYSSSMKPDHSDLNPKGQSYYVEKNRAEIAGKKCLDYIKHANPDYVDNQFTSADDVWADFFADKTTKERFCYIGNTKTKYSVSFETPIVNSDK